MQLRHGADKFAASIQVGYHCQSTMLIFRPLNKVFDNKNELWMQLSNIPDISDFV